MFETGLAVGRSLGRVGIRVLGLDSCKKIGFYSRYIQGSICPHPLEQEEEFIDYLLRLGSREALKPVLFITSDDFLMSVSRNRERLQGSYLMNMPAGHLLESIMDKFKQSELALRAGIAAPRTWIANKLDQLREIQDEIRCPAFVKGREVNSWRRLVGTDRKGFLVRTKEELFAVCSRLFKQNAAGLIQEVIPGPDTNHYKASCYVSRSGEVLLAFGLQKIRQKPVNFGYGCVVQSVHYPELLELGRQFLTSIGYRGVGSVEFKRDQKTDRLTLVELNPRYWQQNALAERCGMNFPLMNYLDVTGAAPRAAVDYAAGVKWINIYDDVESFESYQKEGELSTGEWLNSLRGPKVFSDFAFDDLRPFLFESGRRKLVTGSLRFAVRRLRRAV